MGFWGGRRSAVDGVPGDGPRSQFRVPCPSDRVLGPWVGEIGHGRCQQELGFALEMPPIARLAQAQLHQTGQAMFGHLVPSPIGCKSCAGLQGPGPLQQLFLWE